MRYHSMLHFPLDSAYLCQDCNSVGNNSRTCPACASAVLMSLATVLDREAIAEKHALTYSFPHPVAESFSHPVADITSMVA